MNNLETYADVALLISVLVIVIPCIAGCVLLPRMVRRVGEYVDQFNAHFLNLKQSVPDKSLVEQTVATGKDLSHSLTTHQKVVETMPELLSRKVADQITQGIEPLSNEIATLSKKTEVSIARLSHILGISHDHFLKALVTLNEDGKLTEWVSAFREAVDPLQSTALAIEKHYAVSRELVQNTGNLAIKWGEHWSSVETSFSRFSDVIARWAADEASHLRDTESRVMKRLEEVAGTNAQIAESLSELQTTRTRLMESNESLTRSVQQTANNIEALIRLSQVLQHQHQQDLRAQGEFQEAFRAWQTGIQSQTDAFQVQIRTMTASASKTMEELSTHVQDSIHQMGEMIRAFHHTHGQALDKLIQLHEASHEKQTQLAVKQGVLVDRMAGMITDLPARKIQLIQLGVTITQLIALGVLTYGIFSR